MVHGFGACNIVEKVSFKLNKLNIFVLNSGIVTKLSTRCTDNSLLKNLSTYHRQKHFLS